ncbi:hypothetical protein CBL_08416 [Carabus blaptoides fortunei]
MPRGKKKVSIRLIGGTQQPVVSIIDHATTSANSVIRPITANDVPIADQLIKTVTLPPTYIPVFKFELDDDDPLKAFKLLFKAASTPDTMTLNTAFALFLNILENFISINLEPVYLDETLIFSKGGQRRSWQDVNTASVKKVAGEGTRYIVVHAGGKNGFIKNASFFVFVWKMYWRLSWKSKRRKVCNLVEEFVTAQSRRAKLNYYGQRSISQSCDKSVTNICMEEARYSRPSSKSKCAIFSCIA